MPRVLHLSTLRQQALTATLTTARESCTAGFGAHARTETMLTFPGSFRPLQCPFHKQVSPRAATESG
jgi:hypothetical protein